MTAARPLLVVDFVADIVCPWCYVGLAALEKAVAGLSATHEARIRFRPYQLNPDTPAGGVDRAAYYDRKFPDRAALDAARARLVEMGRAAGLDFDPARPTVLPNTLLAHRAIALSAPSGRQHAFARGLYDAFWSGACDLVDASGLAPVADAAGLDGAVLRRLLDEGAARDEVAAEAAAFARAGVSGVPTFVVNERVGFSGALPADALAGALAEAAGRAQGAV